MQPSGTDSTARTIGKAPREDWEVLAGAAAAHRWTAAQVAQVLADGRGVSSWVRPGECADKGARVAAA